MNSKAIVELEEDSSLTGMAKRSVWMAFLCAALWSALLLWACFEVASLYTWTRRLPGESDTHWKGRMESVGQQSRLVALGFFVGAVGVAALTLAMLYSSRLNALREEMARQRGRRMEVEEMGLAAAGLAHETKNPLGLMRGMAQRIASGSLPKGEVDELATRIIDQADLTSSRLGDFLRYAGVREPAFQTIDAEAALKKIASLLEGDFSLAGVALECSSDKTSIEADPEMLSQILVNLLLNALKFTPQGGKVRLSLRKAFGSKAVLTVSDNGKGISSEILPQIFKPYFSKRAGGCGLGLAIVKRLVDRSGWEIEAESSEGKGAVFTIKGINAKRAS